MRRVGDLSHRRRLSSRAGASRRSVWCAGAAVAATVSAIVDARLQHLRVVSCCRRCRVASDRGVVTREAATERRPRAPSAEAAVAGTDRVGDGLLDRPVGDWSAGVRGVRTAPGSGSGWSPGSAADRGSDLSAPSAGRRCPRWRCRCLWAGRGKFRGGRRPRFRRVAAHDGVPGPLEAGGRMPGQGLGVSLSEAPLAFGNLGCWVQNRFCKRVFKRSLRRFVVGAGRIRGMVVPR